MQVDRGMKELDSGKCLSPIQERKKLAKWLK
jgi:hypothetical protein